MKRYADKIICMMICAAAIGIDQFTKSAVRALMESRQGEELVVIPGFLSLISSFNQGIAFGLFQGVRIYLLFIPVIVAIVILFFFIKENTQGKMVSVVGLGLMLGGAIGNLIDRIRIGQVFDFIEAYYGKMHWPTFNGADAFILIGFCLFAIAMLSGGAKDE